jgi:hypothetical protein
MNEQRDDFYVGYLPTPRKHRRFLRAFIPATLWGLVMIAALFLNSFRPAGSGEWDSANLRSWAGVVRFEPYPTLVVADDDGKIEEWPLVETGKVAADARAEFFEGKYTVVRGYALQRDGRRMIEIMPGHEGILAPVDGEIPAEAIARSLGEVELTGEILDMKCYLGAMLPGDGLTHQTCARLCIDGGIPPMLVSRSAEGEMSYTLLTRADGGRANDLVRRHVAVPVVVRGELVQRGGTRILRIKDLKESS